MAERIYTRRDRVTNKALSDLAFALCADFERRQRAIIEKSASRRVTMEYSYINTRMLLAASEIVGLGDAERFIYEIVRFSNDTVCLCNFTNFTARFCLDFSGNYYCNID